MPCQNCNLTFKSLSPQRSADLQARLRSNQTRVSPSEVGQIAELSADVKGDIDRCDAEISRLHSLIISLENNRRELKSREKVYTSLTAPIRTLPPEILSQVFSHFCGNNAISLPKAPALSILTNVCAHWRNLIISNAMLWSKISMTRSCKEKSLKVLDAYLQRSGQLPFTLECKFNTLEMEVLTMDAFIQHSHRWRDLDVIFGDPASQEMLWDALRGNLPLLERLVIYVEDGDDGIFQAPPYACGSLPRLHTLSLECQIGGIELPWKQLLHLSLSNHDVDDVLRILALCPRLETVKLYHCEKLWDEKKEDRGVYRVLPNLRAITIELGYTKGLSFVSAFFKRITCPLLDTISIEFKSEYSVADRQWPAAVFSSFLSRSACNITSLSLDQLPFPDLDLAAVMTSMPSLTHLRFVEMKERNRMLCLNDSVLRSLLPASSFVYKSSSSLVPNLRSIYLKTDGSSMSDQCFVDVVKSRWSPGAGTGLSTGMGVACLRSVVLRVTEREVDRQILEPLRHLERAGMQISVFDSAGRVE